MGLLRVLNLLKSLLLLSLIGSNFVTARDSSLTTTVQDGNNITSIENHSPPPEPPPPPPPEERSNMAPFKPSIAVIVGVLTTMFSITFLLLLYAKHCKRGNGYYTNSRGRVPPSSARKNSGVDRTVIESLPVFRFGSLRGAKDGLECAVCLNRFESSEVLRLLPKCKHAFHVECVDTWLDAHSTCPLCRYRVDPEDILLIGDAAKILGQNEPLPQPPPLLHEENQRLESLRRVSGRHSSAGERGTGGGFLQIVLHRRGDSTEIHHSSGDNNPPLATRRSLDSWNMTKKKKTTEAVSIGCFDRQHRKDGLLLLTSKDEERTSSERRRLEHRIIIGGGGVSEGSGFHQRWSDVQPSDLLYLRSEMIMSDSRRLSASSSSGSRPSVSRHQNQLLPLPVQNNEGQSGRSVINGRSVSEITGLSRFGNARTGNNHHHQQHHRQQWWQRQEREQQRQAGLVSRWLAWISQSQSQSQSLSLSQSESQQTQPTVRSASPAITA